MSRKFNVAVVGATGAVGETMLEVLAERQFPIGELYALASERSVGREVRCGDRRLKVQDLATFDFSQAQIGLFSAGGSVSAEYAPRAAEAGCVVIDNTSHFRNEPDIPLVVPEVNPHDIADYRDRGIIANPNCSTIQMVVALKPLHDAARIRRINVATYQSVSGTGKQAIEELAGQSAALPHIDSFQENGYTREEMKMVWETRKIFGDADIEVNPTCVRIPVFYGHSEVVHAEFERPLGADEARLLLAQAAGVQVIDERVPGGYPTAAEAAGQDWVYVGRIREDISHPCGLNLWVVSDNIRKGAATNSVQIAERLIAEYLDA
jgi:aspartate-semialdehyde dehydrogenase